MGASTSARRDVTSPGDATTALEHDLLPKERSGGEDVVDSKLLQKNGKISGHTGNADDQSEGFDGRSGEEALAEVGQTDSVLVTQKDDILEVMEVLQDEVSTQMAGKESPEINTLTPTEEKATKEEPGESSEVGFKKIFRFVGFKFTLKKDKPEKSVIKEQPEEVIGTEITAKMAEELDGRKEASESVTDNVASEEADNATQSVEQAETTEEITQEAEPSTSPTVEEIQSPIKRFFTRGIFSSFKKRTSYKKPTEEALLTENVAEKEFKKGAESPKEEGKSSTEEQASSGPEQEQITAPEEPKVGSFTEITLATEDKQYEGGIEVKGHTPQTALEEDTSSRPAITSNDISATEEESKDTVTEWTCHDKARPVMITEGELMTCQDKNKSHDSPLKKLFSGTGLKKRSKKLKGKRDTETKSSISGEDSADQFQSSTESAESPRIDSSFSSPEESTEHVNGDPLQVEAEGDRVTSDEERKRDNIQPWSSFKKLLTPKKRAKMSSESEDEAAEKPKTISSVNNSVFTEQQGDQKHSEDVKAELSTEEPPRKKESSMSWEALLCRGSAKKRARKTSDSDGEKVEEGEDSGRMVGSPVGSSQDGDHELLTSSPEQAGSPSEGDGESTWASLKKLVTPRRRAKSEDRTENSIGFSAKQVPSDSEMSKEDTAVSLKRLIPGRKKKGLDVKKEQVTSDEGGKALESAEEDWETPAVVPLSEFDLEPEEVDVLQKEEAAEKQIDTTEPEATKQELPILEPIVRVPLETEVKQVQGTHIADMEEQSASCILTTAEVESEDKTESISKHQQLSDIPEEGAIEDTTVSPKSPAEEVFQDDTIAEDIIELTSEAVTAPEQASEESLADESTEMVSAVSCLTDSPGTSGETTPVAAGYEVKETKAVLQAAVEYIDSVDIITGRKEVERDSLMHTRSKNTAVGISQDSQEIQPVQEDLVKTSVMGISEVSGLLSAEIVPEAKRDMFEVVGIVQEEVYEGLAEVAKTEFQKKVREAEQINLEEEEEEETLCSQSAQVIEAPIMKVEKEQQHESNVKYYSVVEVVHCIREEFNACMPQLLTAENFEHPATLINVSTSTVNPPTMSTESEIRDITNKVTTETVSCIKFMDDHEVLLEDMEFHSAESIIDKEIEPTSTSTRIAEQDIHERAEEEQEVTIAQQVTEMAANEKQSSATAKESQVVELHEVEGKYTSFLEDSIPASSLTAGPQISDETEAASVIANEVEKLPEDIKSIEMPSNGSIRVEVQSPIGQEAKGESTQLEVADTELSDVHVLEEAEIAVNETHVSHIPKYDQITESIQMEAIESPGNAAQHHQENQRRKPQGVEAETRDVEEYGKEYIGEMGENVEYHLQSKSQAGAVEHDQNQVCSEGCPQRERNIVTELQQDDYLCPPGAQDMEVLLHCENEYVMVRQEDVKEVSLSGLAPYVQSQVEDAADSTGQSGVAEGTSHPREMNDAQQESPCELQTVDHEMSKYLTETTEAVTEQCGQKEHDVQSEAVLTAVEMQVAQVGTCEQKVEISADQCCIVKKTQFGDAVNSVTQDVTESNEGSAKCLISWELEGDIDQKPMEVSEHTAGTTTFEAVSEIAILEDAQSQERSSDEMIVKAIQYGTVQEMKNEATKKIQPQTSGNEEAGIFPAEVKEQAAAIEEITDHFRADVKAMDLIAQIETVEATVEAIEELIKKMEPNSTELTAAS